MLWGFIRAQSYIASYRILQSGFWWFLLCSYVPCDPYDMHYTQKILQKEAHHVLCLRDWECDVRIVDCQNVNSLRLLTLENPIQVMTDIAYIIHTSGSTGTPKQVAVSATTLTRNVLAIQKRIKKESGQGHVYFISESESHQWSLEPGLYFFSPIAFDHHDLYLVIGNRQNTLALLKSVTS